MDNTQSNDAVKLEEDRGIPSVASSNKSGKKMALIFAAVATTMLTLTAVSKMDKEKEAATPEAPQNESYGRSLRDLPHKTTPEEEENEITSGYVVTQPESVYIEPIQDNPAPRQQYQDLQPQRPAPTQRQQAARESDAERWARRAQSNSSVAFDIADPRPAPGQGAPAGDMGFDINAEMQQLAALSQNMNALPGMPNMGDMMPVAGGQGGGAVNPNTQFANDVRGQIVEKAMAMPMGDLEYQIVQGKMIPCTLETAVDSSLPGQVRCIVNRDIYGESGRTILIERGTRAIGQYNSAIQNGQYRIFMVWTRLINQKYDIAIGSPSTDNLGRAGSAGDVEGHFWKRFGNATLLSLLGAGTATYGTDGEQTAANAYRQSITNQFAMQANTSLNAGSEIPDTIHLDQGETIKIMVARDLDFGFMGRSGGLQ